jgi:hypothetical protein
MKSFNGFGEMRSAKHGLSSAGNAILAAVLMAVCLGVARTAPAQTVYAGERGGVMLSVGGTFSGYTLQYGERKMLGASVFVDAETRRRIGIEGEARWLIFHQTANVRAATYMIGPRYYMEFGRFQPYVKGLVGVGEINLAYNYGTGSYLVVAPGGGVDFRINHRIRIRAVDFEYQYWPQTYLSPSTNGGMSSMGVSSGIRIRIF